MTRAGSLVAAILVACACACGGKQTTEPISGPGSSEEPPGPVTDSRTEIEKRRETACTDVGTRITACAVSDAKTEHAAGRISKEKLESITSPEIQKKNTEEFIKKCDAPDMSSRQVRVLEVCMREEAECGPFLSCLDHLNDKGAKDDKATK